MDLRLDLLHGRWNQAHRRAHAIVRGHGLRRPHRRLQADRQQGQLPALHLRSGEWDPDAFELRKPRGRTDPLLSAGGDHRSRQPGLRQGLQVERADGGPARGRHRAHPAPSEVDLAHRRLRDPRDRDGDVRGLEDHPVVGDEQVALDPDLLLRQGRRHRGHGLQPRGHHHRQTRHRPQRPAQEGEAPGRPHPEGGGRRAAPRQSGRARRPPNSPTTPRPARSSAPLPRIATSGTTVSRG